MRWTFSFELEHDDSSNDNYRAPLSTLAGITYSVFLFELIALVFVVRRLEFYNPIVLIIGLPFLYGHALLIDHVLFGRRALEATIYFPELTVFDPIHIIMLLLSLSFSFGVCGSAVWNSTYFNRGRIQKLQLIDLSHAGANRSTWKNSTFLILCCSGLVLYGFNAIGATREDLTAASSSATVIVMQVAVFYACFNLILSKSTSVNFYFILICLFFFSVMAMQREFIFMLFFSLALRISPRKIKSHDVLFGVGLLFLFAGYKPLTLSLVDTFVDGFSEEIFVANFSTIAPSVADLDPQTSLFLWRGFLEESLDFSGFYGSYVTNTTMQFLRFVFPVEWPSLAETTTQYYTQNEMGTASSMFLESMLNFGYFGPLILGATLTHVFIVVESFSRNAAYKLRYLIWGVFILKLVRTELAVVLKLYVLPALIAYFLYSYFQSRRYKSFG